MLHAVPFGDLAQAAMEARLSWIAGRRSTPRPADQGRVIWLWRRRLALPDTTIRATSEASPMAKELDSSSQAALFPPLPPVSLAVSRSPFQETATRKTAALPTVTTASRNVPIGVLPTWFSPVTLNLRFGRRHATTLDRRYRSTGARLSARPYVPVGDAFTRVIALLGRKG